MAVSLTHAFVSPVPDEGVADEVGPNEWNAEHAFTMGTGKVLLRTSPGTGAVEEGDITDFVLTAQIGSAVQAYSANLDAWSAEAPSDYLTTADAATTYQPLDSDLTTIAGLSPSNDDIIQRKAGAWINRTMAQLASDLDTHFLTPAEGNAAYQPLDSDLTAIAGLTTTAAGRSLLTVADDGIDEIVAWDDSAGTMKTMPLADITAEASPGAGDFVLIYGAEGDLRKVDWGDLPSGGGGISNVEEDTSPTLGGNLDLGGFSVGDADAADLTKLSEITATSAELNHVDGVTSAIQTQIDGKQPLDATLTALAAYNTNGLIAQTAADTFAGRTITGTSNQVNVSNGNGVSGNPTLSLPQDIATTSNPQFATIELGHASNTTIGRPGAGDISIEGNVVYRAGGTDVPVADGGSGRSSATEYAVICGGTSSTGVHQSIAGVGTSGQVLTSNGAGALPTFQNAAGGGWTTVVKGSDTSTSSDTTTNADPDLQFSMLASTTYVIEIVAIYTTGATGDFKWGLAGPASPTSITGMGIAFIGTAFSPNVFSAYPTNIAALSSGTEGVVKITLAVVNGANAGTFSFDWAQNTSNGTATVVKAGSYIQYRAA